MRGVGRRMKKTVRCELGEKGESKKKTFLFSDDDSGFKSHSMAFLLTNFCFYSAKLTQRS